MRVGERERETERETDRQTDREGQIHIPLKKRPKIAGGPCQRQGRPIDLGPRRMLASQSNIPACVCVSVIYIYIYQHIHIHT